MMSARKEILYVMKFVAGQSSAELKLICSW